MMAENRQLKRGQILTYEIIDAEEPDLCVTLDGGIKYKGIQLRSLSLDNQPGKILAQFTYDGVERFVSDKTIQKIVGANTSYLDWSYVMRDLKKYLRKEGLKADILRRRAKKGYTLKKIYELDDRYKR